LSLTNKRRDLDEVGGKEKADLRREGRIRTTGGCAWPVPPRKVEGTGGFKKAGKEKERYPYWARGLCDGGNKNVFCTTNKFVNSARSSGATQAWRMVRRIVLARLAE